MTENELKLKGAVHCLRHNIPFVLYSLPDDDDLKFLSGTSGDNLKSDTVFIISPWLAEKDEDEKVFIYDAHTPEELLSGDYDNIVYPPDMIPCRRSTPAMVYKGQIITIKDVLKRDLRSKGKIVLSRVEARAFASIDDDWSMRWVDTAAEAFKNNKSCFNYLLWTPHTGGWICTTPEKLLQVNLKTGEGSTMALAGTMAADDDAAVWDLKNVEEHDMVTDYIIRSLMEHGCSISSIKQRDLQAHNVVHICDDITFMLNNCTPLELADALSPTPAVSGQPVDVAAEVLDHLELHERFLYGGYVTLLDSEEMHAYVTLRCLHFDTQGYCMYAGGGITTKSEPEAEYTETEHKMSAMLNATKELTEPKNCLD